MRLPRCAKSSSYDAAIDFIKARWPQARLIAPKGIWRNTSHWLKDFPRFARGVDALAILTREDRTVGAGALKEVAFLASRSLKAIIALQPIKGHVMVRTYGLIVPVSDADFQTAAVWTPEPRICANANCKKLFRPRWSIRTGISRFEFSRDQNFCSVRCFEEFEHYLSGLREKSRATRHKFGCKYDRYSSNQSARGKPRDLLNRGAGLADYSPDISRLACRRAPS
jgi:hypothetical protein